MSLAKPRSSSPLEIALIVAIFAGWFILGSLSAVVAGFPEPTLSNGDAIGLIVLECVAFVVAGSVLWSRGWRAKDFSIRVTWWLTVVGLLLFAVAVLVSFPAMSLIGGIVGGGDFVQEFGRAISFSLPMAVLLSVVNGTFEEFFLTRYMIDALADHGAPIALGASSLVRIVYHLYQGPIGAVSVLLFGVVVTLFYWRYREVWPVMTAHISADFVAFV